MNTLLIPIKVNALHVSEPTASTPPMADFSRVPYFDHIDRVYRNVTTPFISENLVSQPFSEEHNGLGQGVHLHFQLPTAFRSPMKKLDAHQQRTDDDYTPVPNRWLILKNGIKKWVLESDYLWDEEDADLAKQQKCITVLLSKEGIKGKFINSRCRYLGRHYQFEDWKKQTSEGEYWADYFLGKGLTAVGYGEPAFATFYPNCRNVFGFHDEQGQKNDVYEVYGWYADRFDRVGEILDYYKNSMAYQQTIKQYNPIQIWVRRFQEIQNDKNNQSENLNAFCHQIKTQLVENTQSKLPNPLKQLLEGIKEGKSIQAIGQIMADAEKQFVLYHAILGFAKEYQLNISNPEKLFDGNELSFPEEFVFYGKITIKSDEHTRTLGQNIKIAVGNTSTEAVSAYLAKKIANKLDATLDEEAKIEDKIEAIQLDMLFGKEADLNFKFEEARHKKSFSPVNGGSIWRIDIDSNEDNSAQAPSTSEANAINNLLAEETLQPIYNTLVQKIFLLNQLKRKYNRGQLNIISKQHQLFADWYKYMISAHPPLDDSISYPRADEVMRFIYNYVIKDLEKSLTEVEWLKDKKLYTSQTLGLKGSLSVKKLHTINSFRQQENLSLNSTIQQPSILVQMLDLLFKESNEDISQKLFQSKYRNELDTLLAKYNNYSEEITEFLTRVEKLDALTNSEVDLEEKITDVQIKKAIQSFLNSDIIKGYETIKELLPTKDRLLNIIHFDYNEDESSINNIDNLQQALSNFPKPISIDRTTVVGQLKELREALGAFPVTSDISPKQLLTTIQSLHHKLIAIPVPFAKDLKDFADYAKISVEEVNFVADTTSRLILVIQKYLPFPENELTLSNKQLIELNNQARELEVLFETHLGLTVSRLRKEHIFEKLKNIASLKEVYNRTDSVLKDVHASVFFLKRVKKYYETLKKSALNEERTNQAIKTLGSDLRQLLQYLINHYHQIEGIIPLKEIEEKFNFYLEHINPEKSTTTFDFQKNQAKIADDIAFIVRFLTTLFKTEIDDAFLYSYDKCSPESIKELLLATRNQTIFEILPVFANAIQKTTLRVKNICAELIKHLEPEKKHSILLIIQLAGQVQDIDWLFTQLSTWHTKKRQQNNTTDTLIEHLKKELPKREKTFQSISLAGDSTQIIQSIEYFTKEKLKDIYNALSNQINTLIHSLSNISDKNLHQQLLTQNEEKSILKLLEDLEKAMHEIIHNTLDYDKNGQIKRDKTGQPVLKYASLKYNPPIVQLISEPEGRYYVPKEPVLLIEGDATQSFLPEKSGTASWQTTYVVHFDKKNIKQALPNWRQTIQEIPSQILKTAFWQPTILEWEVDYTPTADPSNNGGFVSDDIINNYALTNAYPDFVFKDAQQANVKVYNLKQKPARTYSSSTILSPYAINAVQDKLKGYSDYIDELLRGRAIVPSKRALENTIQGVISFESTFSNDASIKSKISRLQQQIEIKTAIWSDNILSVIQETLTSLLLYIEEFYPSKEAIKNDISTALDEQYKYKFEVLKYYADEAIDQIKASPMLVSQSLGGFNECLLMRKQTMQLEVDDPVTLPDYKPLIEGIRNYIGDETQSAPEPKHYFNPIRAGILKIKRLRIIDAFGQIQQLKPKEIIKANTLDLVSPKSIATFKNDVLQTQYETSIIDAEGDEFVLPPRFVQPIRLNLRWIAAEDKEVESGGDERTSPICGWIVPNFINLTLVLFDKEGHLIGDLGVVKNLKDEEEVRLIPKPGAHSIIETEINNKYFLRLVRYFLLKGARYFENFLRILNESVQQTDPSNFAQFTDMAMMVGKPLALVRAKAELQVMKDYAVNQDWQIFIQDIRNKDNSYYKRTTYNVEHVKFPLRLGDFRQVNDGLVGFWESNIEASEFQTPITPSGRTFKNLPNLELSIEDTPLYLTMLFDPRAKLHAYTGVVPTKSIDIPTEFYKPALERMKVYFAFGPFITPHQQLRIPIPNNTAFEWRWVQEENFKLHEFSTQPTINKNKLQSAWEKEGYSWKENIWQELLKNNWLKPKDEDTINAYINYLEHEREKLPKLTDLLGDSDNNKAINHTWGKQIDQLLNSLYDGIAPVRTEPQFGQMELREGWLKMMNEL